MALSPDNLDCAPVLLGRLDAHYPGQNCCSTQDPALCTKVAQVRRDSETPIMPGDVLFVRGTARGVLRIGANGGFVGHVVLVFASPRRICQGMPAAKQFESVWPRRNVRELWCVPTVESTRSESGLHRTQTLVFEQPGTHQLMIAGELDMQGLIHECEEDPVELWQSPPDLRSGLRHDLIAEVIQEMAQNTADWSWNTARRAVLHRANVAPRLMQTVERFFEEMQQSWAKPPICTSIVVGFWQRYLCKLANARVMQDGASYSDTAINYILRFMPLRADRSLPGDLVHAMKEAGWKMERQIPPIHQQQHK